MELNYQHGGCALIIFIASLSSLSLTVPMTNQLQTAFHHHVTVLNKGEAPEAPILELGKLILAFHHEPKFDIREGNTNAGDMHERIFFFPQTSLQGPECQEMLKTIQAQQSPFYVLQFTQTTNPTPGFCCTVRYNSKVVGMTCAMIEAEGQQRRLMITFYNQSMIKKIDDTHATILQTAARKSRPGIIVDCGHGGTDSGAQGRFGLIEKEVNLEIGIMVASLLRKQGFDVFLSRGADLFVALDERTLLHEQNSDAMVFVSIHANAAPNPDATGIETFFFDVDKSCPAGKWRSQTTVALMRDRCHESEILARCIHDQVIAQVRRHHKSVVDRDVKSAFLHVLTGPAIPAALIELGFLTNEQEAALMKDKQYRILLAEALSEGIVQYFKQHGA